MITVTTTAETLTTTPTSVDENDDDGLDWTMRHDDGPPAYAPAPAPAPAASTITATTTTIVSAASRGLVINHVTTAAPASASARRRGNQDDGEVRSQPVLLRCFNDDNGANGDGGNTSDEDEGN
ncbi:hypothetical protein SCLCIDRAFT_34801 [Scleroderma citrinum Foug A]|uniref:Uncharacterized protein n=1 Tax=Scleroderma citrinum Foug A TaxID=1036808 RepID=A0A0C3CMU1_9AGAM|nr:hypothetical protein SCLCIDRAFT_34801 [Scleroderma citrinum Foug A]